MSTINDDQLVERLVPKMLSAIRAKAKAVETIPVAEDLTGITSLPAYNTTGGQFKNVLVPLNALKEPALTEGQKAAEAAVNANNAATRAETAADDATEAAEAANAYANRVRYVTESEWKEIFANESWEEGIEYNVYEDSKR